MKIKAATLIRPFKPIIERTGANFMQVCHLIDLKLLLDNRKTNPNSAGKSKDPNNTLIRQLLMYLFVGTMLSLMFLKSNDLFLISFSTQLYLMVMVAISMMAEYSVSLFDTRDNNLIIPLPANGQTLGWARVLHIMIYLLLISLSLVLPALVTTGIKFGIISSMLLLVSSLLNTVFTLFLTIFIYLGLMKFTSGDKLKDVMMYIQVGLTILIMIGYQFIPRYLMPTIETGEIMQPGINFLLIPPAWFAMLTSSSQINNAISLTGALIAVVLPVIAMIFIGRKLFYGFENKLNQLSSGDATNTKVKSESQQKGNNNWFSFITLIMGIKKDELPIFRMMWKLVGRERLFKQSILPMLAYMIIIPIFSVFSNSGLGSIESKYLTFLYFTVMTSSMISAIIIIGNSTHSEWIYRILPNLKPSSILSNTLKAAFGRYFVPVFLIMVAPLFYFKGVIALADIVTIFLFNYLISLSILYFQAPFMPFSQTKAVSQGGKTALRMMLIVFLALPAGFLHAYLSGKNGWFVLIPSAIFLPLLILIDKKWYPRKMTWKLVEVVNKA
jgi:ABC-2 type transport system permease protein